MVDAIVGVAVAVGFVMGFGKEEGVRERETERISKRRVGIKVGRVYSVWKLAKISLNGLDALLAGLSRSRGFFLMSEFREGKKERKKESSV